MIESKHGWENLWTSVTQDGYCGYVNSLAEAEQVRKEFEVEKSLTFVSGKREADFGNHGHDLPDKFRLRFTDLGEHETIKYTGMPFIIVSKYERHCLFGKDKNKKKKERYQNSRSQALSAKQDTEKARRIASEKLREDLITGSNIKKEHRIYISLPKDGEHQEMHLIGQITGFRNPLNKDVRDKLYEMVGHGVPSVSEMRRHLKVYVDTQIFPKANKPALTDAAYYPSDVTIRKHIYLAQLRLRYSKIDQENLMKLVSQWQESYPKDNFDFLPATSNQDQQLDENNINNVQCVEQDDEDEVFSHLITTTKFFFCHQSEFQRHLLYRYWSPNYQKLGKCSSRKTRRLGMEKHMGVSKMTSIIKDHVQSSEKKCRVLEYDSIIGVYHQRGHWDLVIIEPKSFTVYFYNPLGETTFQCRQVLNGWRNYMGRNLFLSGQWELKVKEHSKQKDGSSCGVFCLMYAERHLSGQSLLNITKEDVQRKRTEIGTTLLLFEEHILDCCPCCGLKVDDRKGDLEPRNSTPNLEGSSRVN
ncbi:uncharacterized protein LOC133195018 [Saccostrea echinata]|uniref:uncharacterized protein LOC133195018 n=1 Tax=Saccostrea echinata TaxID=191078 RepID=UPI002A804809|nr:uncharacterized protein LOC133195018 [Saccostrea echinata]